MTNGRYNWKTCSFFMFKNFEDSTIGHGVEVRAYAGDAPISQEVQLQNAAALAIKAHGHLPTDLGRPALRSVEWAGQDLPYGDNLTPIEQAEELCARTGFPIAPRPPYPLQKGRG